MSTHPFKHPSTVAANAITEKATVYTLQTLESNDTYGQSHATKKSYPKAETQYEEVARNGEIFLDKLKGFHRSFGTKFKVPTIGGKALDLHHLFVEVTLRGGIEKVIRDRKWKEVIGAFSFPSTITSASFVLRKYYLSLLYHFEQVYYFQKEVPSITMPDPVRRPINGSVALHVLEDIAIANQLPGQVSPHLEPGSSVAGTIDAKFDNGYLITVNFGSEKLKGVLYHTPMALDKSQSLDTSSAPPHQNRKRYQVALGDPSLPKSNRSGYNFFFAEQAKAFVPWQEKAVSKNIGLQWNRLTEAEKQV